MSAQPEPPLLRPEDTMLRDLWIAGEVYVVPLKLYSEFKFLHAHIDSLVRILTRLTGDADAAKGVEQEARRVVS